MSLALWSPNLLAIVHATSAVELQLARVSVNPPHQLCLLPALLLNKPQVEFPVAPFRPDPCC